MKILWDVTAGMITQSPQGEPLRVAEVLFIQWVQVIVGRMLWRWLPALFVSAVLSELIKRFV